MSQEQEKKKIKIFTDLVAWQESHKLVCMIYTTTKSFPKEEQFGLVPQVRRAAVSVTSNIAEGFSRGSYKEKSHFYAMALGSLTEIQNQLLVAKDVGYIHAGEFAKLAEQSVVASRLLSGLIKKSRTLIHDS